MPERQQVDSCVPGDVVTVTGVVKTISAEVRYDMT